MTSKTVHSTTIPAAPGWSVCSPIQDEAGIAVDIYEAPVVAWFIRVEETNGEVDLCHAQAVVADEVTFSGGPEYLKRPDGLYVEPDGAWYETRKKLIARMQQAATKPDRSRIATNREA